ncbi:MAG: PQQ-like beta-propeller repeat protein [Pyrinomonadaceae bacterium]|nr:PQQ-like beta-propeller repeat protein [Pyrinomonadaceae bacterium]
MIYALSTKDGKELSRFKTGGRVMGCPTLDGHYLYALSDDGYLYKLDRRSASSSGNSTPMAALSHASFPARLRPLMTI